MNGISCHVPIVVITLTKKTLDHKSEPILSLLSSKKFVNKQMTVGNVINQKLYMQWNGNRFSAL